MYPYRGSSRVEVSAPWMRSICARVVFPNLRCATTTANRLHGGSRPMRSATSSWPGCSFRPSSISLMRCTVSDFYDLSRNQPVIAANRRDSPRNSRKSRLTGLVASRVQLRSRRWPPRRARAETLARSQVPVLQRDSSHHDHAHRGLATVLLHLRHRLRDERQECLRLLLCLL